MAFKTEVDAMPGGFVASGSMKGRSSGAEISDVVRGARPIRKIFSKEQRAFYAEHAPEGIELDSLITLGPTFLLKLQCLRPRSCSVSSSRRCGSTNWHGSRILELSTKAQPREAFQVRRRHWGLPRVKGRGPERRSADEDADRAELLQEPAEGCREEGGVGRCGGGEGIGAEGVGTTRGRPDARFGSRSPGFSAGVCPRLAIGSSCGSDPL